MPIARLTHEETAPNGDLLHLVKCPNKEFDGRRLGIRFYNGRAKTSVPEKAKYFSEVLGYTVYLHKDADRDYFKIATEKKGKTARFGEETPEFDVMDQEEDYEEANDYEEEDY